MASSLSSVVSNLVRASMGTSVSGTVTDDDLDRHVAELILREAKKKAERYGQQGIRAYISSNLTDSNAPRANKRFLTSIIKSTDDHNKTILRAQAQAAQEIKREKDEQERSQRRARAQEAAEAEKLRRSGRKSSKRRRTAEDEGWDRWDGRTADRKRKKKRNWETGEEEDDIDIQKQRPRSRSSSKEHRKSRRSRHPNGTRDDDGSSGTRHRNGRGDTRSSSRTRSKERNYYKRDDATRRKRHRSESRHRSHRTHRRHSMSPSGSERPRSRSPTMRDNESKSKKRTHSPRIALEDLNEDDGPNPDRHLSPRRSVARSEDHADLNTSSIPSHGRSRSITLERNFPKKSKECSKSPLYNAFTPNASDRRSASRSPTPGPEASIQLPSKMDRYFEETYDPRLDVAPLAAPKVPATGLIDNAEFEGWDAMLQLIRQRQEDRQEKKRLERMGLSKEKIKESIYGTTTSSGVADRWSGEGVSVMSIEYKKRGTVREWDLGKEGF